MAAVSITPVKLTGYNKVCTAITTASLTTAVDATDGATFVMDEADEKYLVMVSNVHVSAAKSVTFKAGNGLQAVGDYTVEIAAGKSVVLALESGVFKNVSGTNKGKVVITGTSADIEVAVFVLP